jgi:hypothetical protein
MREHESSVKPLLVGEQRFAGPWSRLLPQGLDATSRRRNAVSRLPRLSVAARADRLPGQLPWVTVVPASVLSDPGSSSSGGGGVVFGPVSSET